ncbi:uncharacterized protein LOC135168433 [Diachasmimorpha longicaudata]|uniref:uncharacterized protein LOC135168433 n=1 Tax=Diachasmimorpha longicaudata TaxID=58733 RepID=UPI0030B88716
MNDFAVARNNHMIETQKLAGTAPSILRSVVSAIYENKDDFDLKKLRTRMRDSAKLAAEDLRTVSGANVRYVYRSLNQPDSGLKATIELPMYHNDLRNPVIAYDPRGVHPRDGIGVTSGDVPTGWIRFKPSLPDTSNCCPYVFNSIDRVSISICASVR